MESAIVCPVCTLFLRPGMTLESHLELHPKDKVIEALVRLHSTPADGHPPMNPPPTPPHQQNVILCYTDDPTTTAPTQTSNHSFIYQQILSSSSQQSQFVSIPGFNQPNVVYQHQRMIVASSPSTKATLRRLMPKPSSCADIVELHDDATIEKTGTHLEMDEAALEDDKEASASLKMDIGETCVQVLPNIACTKDDFPPLDLQQEVLAVDDHHFDVSNETDVIDTTAIIEVVSNAGFPGFKEESPVLSTFGAQLSADENVSIDSANIRAEEQLSGQESNSCNASVASWSRVQCGEGSSRMSSSYDLIAREHWDESESDSEASFHCRPVDDAVIISGSSRQGIEYKCDACDESFTCPKERREHQARVHDAAAAAPEAAAAAVSTTSSGSCNIIGSRLFGAAGAKKLVIKPRQREFIKTEKSEDAAAPAAHSFEPIFSIKKLEQEEKPDVLLPPLEVKMDVKPLPLVPILCVQCCSIVKDVPTLRDHQILHHGYLPETKYRCGVCHEGFVAEPKYTEHLAIHPLECQFCGKFFTRMANMQLHLKRHLGIRPYKCIVCSKFFITRQKLQEHETIHTGATPFQCNVCNEKFKRHSNLIQHRNRHHLMIKRKLKDFVCTTCGDVFHSSRKLAWHKEVHDNKPKSCAHCSEKFIHVSSLTRHIRRAHNESFVPQAERAKENVECPICKGIYLRSSLDTHIKAHSGAKNFACSVCDKEFTTKWNLKMHKWTHAGRAQKPFKCLQCSAAFIRLADLTGHMNSHKSVRPYTCNHCGAQFIRKSNCQRHVKEHEQGKTFACNICGKTFHRSYYLNDHMRVHSGNRPFSCHICGKASTTKSNHNKHLRIHHAREPVTTEN